MKVIFLDHDGVICLLNNWGSRGEKFNKYKKKFPETTGYRQCDVFHRFDDFDENAVKVLNEILLETDAKIVVSSDWKMHATLSELREYYTSQGIIRTPFAITPSFIGATKPDGFIWEHNRQYEQQRCIEIAQYLKDHPEITHWVAIDDLQMARKVETRYEGNIIRDWGLTNFVWTPRENEGIKQSGIKEQILNFLK